MLGDHICCTARDPGLTISCDKPEIMTLHFLRAAYAYGRHGLHAQNVLVMHNSNVVNIGAIA